MTASTGLDDALKLETVYYSAPVPRDLPTLTVLGTVFDKVYFPGVYCVWKIPIGWGSASCFLRSRTAWR